MSFWESLQHCIGKHLFCISRSISLGKSKGHLQISPDCFLKTQDPTSRTTILTLMASEFVVPGNFFKMGEQNNSTQPLLSFLQNNEFETFHTKNLCRRFVPARNMCQHRSVIHTVRNRILKNRDRRRLLLFTAVYSRPKQSHSEKETLQTASASSVGCEKGTQCAS